MFRTPGGPGSSRGLAGGLGWCLGQTCEADPATQQYGGSKSSGEVVSRGLSAGNIWFRLMETVPPEIGLSFFFFFPSTVWMGKLEAMNIPLLFPVTLRGPASSRHLLCCTPCLPFARSTFSCLLPASPPFQASVVRAASITSPAFYSVCFLPLERCNAVAKAHNDLARPVLMQV